MIFNYDIYISYAKEDDIASEDQKGWVSNFTHFLEMILGQLFTQKINFLFYQNGEHPNEEEMKKAGLMICIMSENYLNSTDCLEDLHLFFENAKKNDAPRIPVERRIFKVMKSSLSSEKQPAKIQEFLEYDLFYFDLETNNTTGFEDFFNEQAEENFWTQLMDLAYDIYKSIQLFRGDDQYIREGANARQSLNKTIYIAETIPQLWSYKNIIKRELQRYGYDILPEQSLPPHAKEIEVAVRKYLERCCLSIHLIGSSYGEVLAGSDISITELQNKIATEHSNLSVALTEPGRPNAFSRMIWIPPILVETEERQEIFLEQLKMELEALESAEILQIPLEDFKTVVKEELRKKESLKPSEIYHQHSNQALNLYLLFDKSDTKDIEPILEILKQKEVNILLPLSKGNVLEVYEKHVENLVNCDYVLIYTNVVNHQWLRMKLLDLKKAPGFGRRKEIRGKFLFSPNGNDIDPVQIQKQGIVKINTLEEISKTVFSK